MNEQKILEEIKNNTLEELEIIYDTQKDLYTDEEMTIIYNKINEIKEKKEQERLQKIKELIPNEIECPKCSEPNNFENNECCFCGYVLAEYKSCLTDYIVENYNEDYDHNENYNKESQKSYLFHYIISFFIPLIGFILGAIMLTKDHDKEVSVGKACIIIGIVSSILNSALLAMIFS